MNKVTGFKTKTFAIAAFIAFSFAVPQFAAAHCDTLDGPVIQDAKKAIKGNDITPVLKWVKPKDEKAVKTAFKKALAAKGKKLKRPTCNFSRPWLKYIGLVRVHPSPV